MYWTLMIGCITLTTCIIMIGVAFQRGETVEEWQDRQW
jgi:hypothetical protein